MIGRPAPAGAARRTTIARKPPAESASKAARGATGESPKRRSPKPPAGLSEATKALGTPRKKAAAAGPRPQATPPEPREASVEPSQLDRVQAVIVESLEADKGEGIVTLDLAGRASFADRMIIATGLADRQISAMATHLEESLHKAGVKRVLIEGAGGSDWVLIDAGDIIVHLFKPEARTLYALERMWGAELDEGEPVHVAPSAESA